MKLSIALSIVLASSPYVTPFTPTLQTTVHRGTTSVVSAPSINTVPSASSIRYHGAPSSSCSYNTCLSMVGGGMIERPPGGDDGNDDSSKDELASDTPGASSSESSQQRQIDTYSMMEAEKEKFLQKIGRDIDINPWDPNPYIKPRPGKYGWEGKDNKEQLSMAQAQELLTKLSDEEIMNSTESNVNPLSEEEREENLNVIRRLRQTDVPTLRRANDYMAMNEAAMDASEREKSDPWYELNERLGDAIKYDTEDVEKLKTLIDKVGGPPPQLVKYADNPRGYITRSEIIGMAISNERLERMLDRRTAYENAVNREQTRKDQVRALMQSTENPKQNEEAEFAEIAKIKQEREEEWLRNMMEQETVEGYKERANEREKEYEDKRAELLKQWGGETPDDPTVVSEEYMKTKGNFVDTTMKDFVGDLKRMNNLFEDDFDDADVGELGLAEADAAEDGAGDFADKPMSKAAQARAEAMKNDGSGRPRLPGDEDVTKGELDDELEINEASSSTTGPLTVEVSSAYNSENSDPPMRKHCFQYTVRITNNSDKDTVQLLSRRFEIQTVGSSMKDVVQGEGVTGRQPVLQPGEVFEYTSTAPLSVRPIGTTEIAARMSGEYRYCILKEGQEKADDEQVNKGQGEAGAELATFHFVFPEEQRVKPVRPSDDDDDDDEDDDVEDAVKTTTVASSTSSAATSTPPAAKDAATTPSTPASSLPGEPDMTSGNISTTAPNDSSDTLTSDVRVVVTSTYRPERSDAKLDKHCFAYNVRITNESKNDQSIQLVSRRFEIQTVGSANKDVVQGPGVTGRQPVLKPGESFEYTSTAPLSVRPMLDKTKVVARMSGEYNFVQLGEDGKTPLSSTPLKAELGAFHFILPE